MLTNTHNSEVAAMEIYSLESFDADESTIDFCNGHRRDCGYHGHLDNGLCDECHDLKEKENWFNAADAAVIAMAEAHGWTARFPERAVSSWSTYIQLDVNDETADALEDAGVDSWDAEEITYLKVRISDHEPVYGCDVSIRFDLDRSLVWLENALKKCNAEIQKALSEV